MNTLLFASGTFDHTNGPAAFARPDTATLVVRQGPDRLVPVAVDDGNPGLRDFVVAAEEYVHRATGNASPLTAHLACVEPSGAVFGMRLGPALRGVEISRYHPGRGWQPLSRDEEPYFMTIGDPYEDATRFTDSATAFGLGRLAGGAEEFDPDALEREVFSDGVVNALLAEPTRLQRPRPGSPLPTGRSFAAPPPAGPGSLVDHWRNRPGGPWQPGARRGTSR